MYFVAFASLLISITSFQTFVTGKNSTNLAEKIRRQLMRDNYDYMSADDEASYAEKLSQADDYDSDNTKRKNPLKDEIIPRAHDEEEEFQDAAALNKDFVYYINDERLEKATLDDYNLNDDSNVTTPKVKYKILKVNNPSRRSMTQHRFIQEEKDDGVAIMNLDDGPIPEFILPKSRRQYMQDTEEVDDSKTLSELDDLLVENSTPLPIKKPINV